jgi:hypothetical protein
MRAFLVCTKILPDFVMRLEAVGYEVVVCKKVPSEVNGTTHDRIDLSTYKYLSGSLWIEKPNSQGEST